LLQLEADVVGGDQGEGIDTHTKDAGVEIICAKIEQPEAVEGDQGKGDAEAMDAHKGLEV
jgi:hypothetical protein